MTDRTAVLSALGAVRDPELDEAITELGFVSSCQVSAHDDVGEDADGSAGGAGVDVEVRLRLPTYFCAPNFAFLMVADAYDAVSAVPGVRRTEVVLEDHFASDAINNGVRARSGFAESFDGEAAGELDELRAEFVRKAVLAGTDRVCRPLVAAGYTTNQLAAMRLGDVAPSPDRERLRSRRQELGLPSGDDSPLLVDAATGVAVGATVLTMHLRRARLTSVNTEANAGVCRGMLRHRYGDVG